MVERSEPDNVYIVMRATADGPQYLANPGVWQHDLIRAQLMPIVDAQYAAFHESTKRRPARAIPLREANKLGEDPQNG